jgi:DNA polymerase-3 subunit delta
VGVFLVSGSDARLVSARLSDLAEELVADGDRSTMYESHDLADASADDKPEIIAAAVVGAQTSSLFADSRVVVLRGVNEATVDQLTPLVAYLADPLPTTNLVLTATGKLPKSIHDAVKQAGCTFFDTNPPGRKNELTDWFATQFMEAGIKVEPGALAQVVEWLGQDQARLPSLIDVLVATYGSTKKLSIADIEPFLGDKGSVLPWDLTDAIDRGDAAKALAMLRRMVRSGEYHPLQIMSLLHNHYVRLMRLDGPDVRSSQDAMSLIGSKSDFQARKYLDTYRRMGSRNVAASVQLLARADVDLRGGKDLEDELVMEIVVARLSRLSGSAVTSKRR